MGLTRGVPGFRNSGRGVDPPTRSDQTEGGSLRLKKYERGGLRETPRLNHE